MGSDQDVSPCGPLVVVRLPNFLGELVMAEPMLRSITGAGLRPLAFGRPWCRELLAGVGISVETVASGMDESRQYRSTGARWGLTARGSFTTALRMRLGGLRVIGRRDNLRTPLLSRSLPRSFAGHRVDDFLELGRTTIEVILGGVASALESPVLPRITSTAGQRDKAAALLKEEGVKEPFVMACPTAGHRRASTFKLWPHFPALLRRLVDAGVEVVICPGRGETDWYRGIPEPVRVLEGVGMGCLVGIASRAAAMVSNDTGPAHLAAALGIPTLTLFGDTDQKRYAPRGVRAVHLGGLGAWPSLEEGWRLCRELVGAPTHSSWQSGRSSARAAPG